MPPIEVGRICVKLTGREVGRKCVILKVLNKNFVLVSGPLDISGVRRRRANIQHLHLTKNKISISKDSTDEDIKKGLKEANLLDYMASVVKINV